MKDWFENHCIGDLPSRAARHWGSREALVFETERTSFAELDRSVDQVARGLIALGIQPGDKVALWYPNRPAWLHAFFAITKIGAIAVLLNTRFRVDDVAYVLRASDARALLIVDRVGPVDFSSMTREVVANPSDAGPLQLEIVIVDGDPPDSGMMSWREVLSSGDGVSSEELADRARSVSPSDPAMMLFTSGSTGSPKGVVHCHNPIENVVHEVERMRVSESDTVLMYLPLFHTLGLYEGALTQIVAGTRMVLQERFDADEALRLIERERCTLIHGFDTHFKDLLESPELTRRDTSSLRTGILAAGMPSTEPIARATQHRLMKTVSGWGMTEVGCGALLGSPSDDEEARCLGSGHPLPGYEMRIVDTDTGDIREDDGTGELQVRSHQMFMGYHGAPDATAASFTADGWFRTGDLACWRGDGSIRFLGRNKDMLKVGGENVDPIEVEAFLERHPGVVRAQIVGYPDRRLGEVAVACVIPDPELGITEQHVLQYCKGRIASFKAPRRVLFVAEFPMTSSGKIQRFLLREQASERLTSLETR